MKDQISEELLSAYFDGELSAKECAQVEKWLNSNSEAKQQVADYRRLSRMFEGLSRSEVPPEFATEVLHRAERRMLLPDVSAVPRRRQIRVWWLAIPATAAAALMLTLNFWGGDLQPGRGDIAQRNGRPSRGEPIVVPGHGSAQANRDEFAVPVGRRTAGPDDGPPTEAHPTGGAEEAVAKIAGESGAPEDEHSVASAPADDNDPPPSAAEQLAAAVVEEALGTAQEADAKAQDANGVPRAMPVVTIYVDGVQGLALLQKICEDYRIVTAPTENPGDSGESNREIVDGTTSSAASQQALCIVVTDPEPIIRAFAQMIQERHSGVRIAAEEPIVLADLDPTSQQRVTEAVEEVSRNMARFAELAAKDPAGPEQAVADSPSDPREEDGQKSAPAATARKSGTKPAPGGTAARRKPTGIGSLSARKWWHSGAETERSASVPRPAEIPAKVEIATDAEVSAASEALARQLVVPVPPAYQNRSRADSSNKRLATNAATDSQRAAQVPQPATSDDPPTEEKIAGEQSTTDGESANHPPEIVRMLIVVDTTGAPPKKQAEKSADNNK
jgi:hypothetical protein